MHTRSLNCCCLFIAYSILSLTHTYAIALCMWERVSEKERRVGGGNADEEESESEGVRETGRGRSERERAVFSYHRANTLQVVIIHVSLECHRWLDKEVGAYHTVVTLFSPWSSVLSGCCHFVIFLYFRLFSGLLLTNVYGTALRGYPCNIIRQRKCHPKLPITGHLPRTYTISIIWIHYTLLV